MQFFIAEKEWVNIKTHDAITWQLIFSSNGSKEKEKKKRPGRETAWRAGRIRENSRVFFHILENKAILERYKGLFTSNCEERPIGKFDDCTHPSTQAFSSRSLDSTCCEMSWRHRRTGSRGVLFGDVTKFRAKWCERQENAWVLGWTAPKLLKGFWLIYKPKITVNRRIVPVEKKARKVHFQGQNVTV